MIHTPSAHTRRRSVAPDIPPKRQSREKVLGATEQPKHAHVPAGWLHPQPHLHAAERNRHVTSGETAEQLLPTAVALRTELLTTPLPTVSIGPKYNL